MAQQESPNACERIKCSLNGQGLCGAIGLATLKVLQQIDPSKCPQNSYAGDAVRDANEAYKNAEEWLEEKCSIYSEKDTNIGRIINVVGQSSPSSLAEAVGKVHDTYSHLSRILLDDVNSAQEELNRISNTPIRIT